MVQIIQYFDRNCGSYYAIKKIMHNKTIECFDYTVLSLQLFVGKRRGRILLRNSRVAPASEVWQKGGQHAEQGQIGAQVINKFNAVLVSNLTEHCGADSGHAEGEAEEETGYGTHFAGNEFLRKHENGREGGSKDEPYNESEDTGPLEISVRHGKREGRRTQDREPDHALSADAVANRPAYDRANRHSEQKREQVQLRRLYGQVEAVY